MKIEGEIYWEHKPDYSDGYSSDRQIEIYNDPDYFRRMMMHLTDSADAKDKDHHIRLISSRVVPSRDPRLTQKDFIIYVEKEIEDPELLQLADDLFSIGGLAKCSRGYIYVRIVSESYYTSGGDTMNIQRSYTHKMRLNISQIEEPVNPDLMTHEPCALNVIPIGEIYGGSLFTSFTYPYYDSNRIYSEIHKENFILSSYARIFDLAMTIFNGDKVAIEYAGLEHIIQAEQVNMEVRFDGRGLTGCK